MNAIRPILKCIYEADNFTFYEYKPSLLRLLYVDFERMSYVRHVRLMLEWLGVNSYYVYYLARNGVLVGYCVVVPGGRRLKCSKKNDIVLGPYYIKPEFRGMGYSRVLISLSLKYCRYPYKYAYDYIDKENYPSINASLSCGFEMFGELRVTEISHKLVETPAGAGTHYIFKFDITQSNCISNSVNH